MEENRKVELSKELITPARAERLLKRNTNNRSVRDSAVNRYADDMKSGNWNEDVINPIVISKDGRLLDGQHRLLAIKNSGTSIWCSIEYGADDSQYDYIDNGVPRRTADYVIGPNKVGKTAIGSIAYCFKYGTMPISTCVHGQISNKRKPSRNNVKDYINNNSDYYNELVIDSVRVKKQIGIGKPKIYGAFLFFIEYVEDDKEAVNAFRNEFTKETPDSIFIIQCKQKLGRKLFTERVLDSDMFAMLLKIYDAYKQGKKSIVFNHLDSVLQKYNEKLYNRREYQNEHK